MNKTILALILISTNIFASEIKLSSEDSVSLDSTSGNTELKTYVLKSSNSLKINENDFKIKGLYKYGESENIRNSESWKISLRYDRDILRKLKSFIGEKIESNRYSSIKRRYNYDLGAKYVFSKNDNKSFFAEMGYRYTIEKSTKKLIEDDKDSKGRIFIESSRKLGERISVKLWVEYLHNFSRPEDMLINIEPSVSLSLGKLLSLQSSYLWEYDDDPASEIGKHDYQYLMSLIAKF